MLDYVVVTNISADKIGMDEREIEREREGQQIIAQIIIYD